MSQNVTNVTTKKLSPKQKNAIPHILNTSSLEEAAKKSKVSRMTLKRWMDQPHFKKIINTRRDEIFQEAMTLLKGASKDAVLKLMVLLKSKNPNTARLSAIALLKYSVRADEQMDILERIEKLEEFIENRLVS